MSRANWAVGRIARLKAKVSVYIVRIAIRREHRCDAKVVYGNEYSIFTPMEVNSEGCNFGESFRGGQEAIGLIALTYITQSVECVCRLHFKATSLWHECRNSLSLGVHLCNGRSTSTVDHRAHEWILGSLRELVGIGDLVLSAGSFNKVLKLSCQRIFHLRHVLSLAIALTEIGQICIASALDDHKADSVDGLTICPISHLNIHRMRCRLSIRINVWRKCDLDYVRSQSSFGVARMRKRAIFKLGIGPEFKSCPQTTCSSICREFLSRLNIYRPCCKEGLLSNVEDRWFHAAIRQSGMFCLVCDENACAGPSRGQSRI